VAIARAEDRWVTVTPSQFQHEREALEYVRQLLPDAEPYRAWSNFTFTADTGHVRIRTYQCLFWPANTLQLS
jgi:hypothetical protein